MSLEPLQLALRVLSAIVEHRQPEAVDLEALQCLAPLQRDLPADELACEVIQQALKTRAEERARAAGL